MSMVKRDILSRLPKEKAKGRRKETARFSENGFVFGVPKVDYSVSGKGLRERTDIKIGISASLVEEQDAAVGQARAVEGGGQVLTLPPPEAAGKEHLKC